MQYKIVRHQRESIYLSSKKDLFDFMEIFSRKNWSGNISLYSLGQYFTENFVIGLKGNFEVSRQETTRKNIYSGLYENYSEIVKYVNGIFIVYNEHGVKVDLTILIKEFSQSRGLNKKNNRQYKYYDRSTNAWRKHTNSYCKVYSRNNSFKKEYRDNITAKEYGVKIRSSRAKEVESYHIWMHEDSMEYKKPERNWKSQSKKRKQWKNKK